MKMLVRFLALAALSVTGGAYAQDVHSEAEVVTEGGVVNAVDLGPAVGAQLPHDLTTVTSAGAETNFDQLVGEKGLALFFVRSVDWCPYCRAQAVDVNGRVQEFKDRGLNVAFISYDSPKKQTPFVEKWDFEPTLLSDENIEIINAFGLRNESHEEGSRFYGIPHPVVFVVNPDKQIVAKLYEEDFMSNDKSYRERPAVDLILDVVDEAIGG